MFFDLTKLFNLNYNTNLPMFSAFLNTKLFNVHIWNITFFCLIFYLIFIFSITMYFTPLITNFNANAVAVNTTSYMHISTESMYKFLLTPIIFLVLIVYSWTSTTLTIWFGQLTMSTLQRTVTLFALSSFFITYYIYCTNLIFNTKEIYEFIIVLVNTLIWVFFLFYANNMFTIIFFIEILTGLTVLILITSAFSSAYNYNVTNFYKNLYFQSVIPKNTLDSLIFFFWMSLLSSLLLFIFLIFFYLQVYTFEFSLIELLITHIVVVTTFKQFLTVLMTSFIFLLIIFLKCGLVPLYVWKPIVFKGMTLHAIFFYICFYYYFLLLFFVYLLVIYLNDILWYNKFIMIIVLLLGIITLFTILIESYYFKSFLAMSSILNTLLIVLGLTSLSVSNYFFFL